MWQLIVTNNDTTFKRGCIIYKSNAEGMLESIKFPITEAEFIAHIWKIILVKERGVCAWCCQYCEGLGDYKAN